MKLSEFQIDKQTNEFGCLFDTDFSPEDLMRSFDKLPPKIRERMRESPWKLCVLCVEESADENPEQDMLNHIVEMERQIAKKVMQL